jgi:hypothetical protein
MAQGEDLADNNIFSEEKEFFSKARWIIPTAPFCFQEV